MPADSGAPAAMESSQQRSHAKYCGVLFALIFCQSGLLLGQSAPFGPSSSINAPSEAIGPAPVAFVGIPKGAEQPHRFWDNRNRALFATSAALSAGDFFITRSNLQSGGREFNPVTRLFGTTTPGLALNFSLETGSVIGASYILHKTGHHKLERITSLLNIGGSAVAVSYGVSHR